MKKFKNGGFWVSLVSAILLILQAIFGWKIDNAFVTEISSSVLGLLVVVGIVKDHSATKKSKDDTNSTPDETISPDDKDASKTEIEQDSNKE